MGQCNQETLKVRERLTGGNHRDEKAAGGLSLLPPALQTEEWGHETRNVTLVETGKDKGCGFSLESPDGEAPC